MGKKSTKRATPRNGKKTSIRNGNGNGSSKPQNGPKNGNRRTRSKPAESAMIVRRNSTTLRTRSSKLEPEPPVRTPMAQRIDNMGASHVAAGVVSASAFTGLAITAVGQGWVGPKTSAGILMGVGAATTAVGVYGEHDHVMMAGAGITAAGAVSLANQLAVDGYEAMEKRAEERKAKKQAETAEKDKAKKLAEARALIAETEKKQRNGRRIVITDQDGEPIDFAVREAAGGDQDDDDELVVPNDS